MFSEFTIARMMFQIALVRRDALRAQPRDLGASALEWAIISAILVSAAVLIGGIIYNVIKNKGADLTKCGSAAPGATGC